MKILIDARLYGAKHRGIGRYSAKIIEQLEQLDQANDYIILLQPDCYDDYQPANPRFKKININIRVYSFKEQWLLPLIAWRLGADLTHFTHLNVPLFWPGPFVMTIHDLIISHFPASRATTLPRWLYKIKLFFYDWVVLSAARRAKVIIAVSQFTKTDIIKLLDIAEEKIVVAYEGADLPEAEATDFDHLAGKFKITAPYLLYVGSAYPHKNLEKLLDVFVILARERDQLQLVFVGQSDYFYFRLKDLVQNSYSVVAAKIIFTGRLNDSELVAVYHHARLYVFASLLEGFGLPPLEAQGLGLPVVSSNASCLPEVLGDGALYFNPEDIEDMARQISRGLDDENLRQGLVAKGQENFARFSWTDGAKKTLEAYWRLK